MTKPIRVALVLLASLVVLLSFAQEAVPQSTVVPEAEKDAAAAVAREYTQSFYNGELEKLRGMFSEEMKSTLSMEQLAGIRQQIAARFGKEAELLNEDVVRQGEATGYRRTARFEQGTILDVLFLVRPDGEIAGFFIRPANIPKSEGN